MLYRLFCGDAKYTDRKNVTMNIRMTVLQGYTPLHGMWHFLLDFIVDFCPIPTIADLYKTKKKT